MPITLPFHDPVLIFGFAMVLLLLAPLLARQLRLPDILGLIVAGILVGPNGFGLLEKDATFDLLGKVGILYIMFLAGLEIDLVQLRHNKLATVVFGLLTFAIPLALGIALGWWVFGMSLTVAVLLASMFSSHTLLTLPILQKMGLVKSRSAGVAIGGTIITDTLALLILAAIAASAQGELDAWFWLRLGGGSLVFVVAMALVLPRLGGWFFRRFGSDENTQFVFVLALVFICGWLAFLVGLEPIIGAFLAGLLFNRLIPEKGVLMSRLHFAGNALFIPFFLLSVGMLVDLKALVSGSGALVIAGGMLGVALVSKLLAAWISGKILGFRASEIGVLYGLSVNQAAATLAAVLIGYNLRLFSQDVVTGTIIMIGLSCFVGSLVSNRAARRLAAETHEALDQDQIRRLGSRLQLRHGSLRVLVALAPGSPAESDQRLLDLALLLRTEGSREAVFGLQVALDGPGCQKQLLAAETQLAPWVLRGISANLPVQALTAVESNIARGIVNAGRSNRSGLVLMAWDAHSPQFGRVYGHVLDPVIHQYPGMVLANRLIQPVSVCRRLVVYLPPMASRSAGIPELLIALKSLARHGGMVLVLISGEAGSPEGKADLETLLGELHLGSPAHVLPVANWKNAVEESLDHVRKDDWLVWVGSRRGEVTWQPAQDRLPSRLGQRWPGHNLTLALAAAMEADLDALPELELDPPDHRGEGGEPLEALAPTDDGRQLAEYLGLFARRRTLFVPAFESVSQAIIRLLACHSWPEAPALDELHRGLLEICKEAPVELGPGILLLHGYTDLVQDSTVFLGICPGGLGLSLGGGDVRVLVVLLDPETQDPGRHLQALARIARTLGRSDMAGQLAECRDFDDLVRLLRNPAGG